jgi:hypothetical protein
MNCLLCKTNELIKKENLICKDCYSINFYCYSVNIYDRYKLDKSIIEKIIEKVRYFDDQNFAVAYFKGLNFKKVSDKNTITKFEQLFLKIEYIHLDTLSYNLFDIKTRGIYFKYLEKFDFSSLINYIFDQLNHVITGQLFCTFNRILKTLTIILRRNNLFYNKKIINYYFREFVEEPRVIRSEKHQVKYDRVLQTFKECDNHICFNLQEIILNEFMGIFIKHSTRLNIPEEFCEEIEKVIQCPFLRENIEWSLN